MRGQALSAFVLHEEFSELCWAYSSMLFLVSEKFLSSGFFYTGKSSNKGRGLLELCDVVRLFEGVQARANCRRLAC